MRVRSQLLALVLAGMPAACGARAAAPAPPALATLPDVALTTLDDRPTRLADVVGRRPAVVALWATWCDACRAERAALDRLDRAARPRGGIVVGLSVGEGSDAVREDLGRSPVGYTQLVDEPFAFANAAGVHTLPTVFVIDREGRVVHAGGALDHAALAAFRRALGAD